MIYANLPSDIQAKISDAPLWPSQGLFATIIAENVDHHRQDRSSTSFDPGFTKQNSYYNSKTGIWSRMLISGRPSPRPRTRTVAPGKCMKLYTIMLREVEDSTIPEVQRTNLDSMCGLTSPPAQTLIRALEQLCALSALDDRGELAKMGWRIWPSFRWTHS